MGCIYNILCKVTHKSYIGKTIQSLSTRIKQHRYVSKNPTRHHCRCLVNAIIEHGWDNFEVTTLWEGDNKNLGEMEKYFIHKYNTIEPNGYNIREGGGKSERVSETSRKLMVEKQRNISKRRNGLIGRIISNKSKINGEITSWSVKCYRDSRPYTIGCYKTYEEALNIQIEYTNDPDNFMIPEPKRVSNGKGGIYYDKSRKNKWRVMTHKNGKNHYHGSFSSREEAENCLKVHVDK